MSEVRDPAIKLFGKTIALNQEKGILNFSTCVHRHDNKVTSEGELTKGKHKDDFIDPPADMLIEPDTSSGISDDPKQDTGKETLSPKSFKDEYTSDEKTLKKPDKILPCPRCNSMETKFCYYNNYNVNQPRYFCKNCQRYWTAGGTMRNVPVGSGRRKNKSSSTSHYHHIKVSDALQVANGMHIPNLRANGTVLTFGSDKPLCDTMVSVLNLAEKSQNCTANGFHGPEQRMPNSCKEIGSDESSGPCNTASNLTEKANNSGANDSAWKNSQSFSPQVPYFPGSPWAFPWNAAQWRSAMPQPSVTPPGFPVSFYSATPYWGCTMPSPWNVPWLSPTPSSSDQSVHSTSPNSPTLGKHYRDGSMLNPSHPGTEDSLHEKDAERGVLIPKTLRIDDPNDTAKSSIWSTLGIKNEKVDLVHGARLFKAFNSKADHRNHEADTSLVLQANPAALSRSHNFRETTQ